MSDVVADPIGKPSRLQMASVSAYLLAFATDYRSENPGGDLYQIVLLLIACGAFLLALRTLGTRDSIKIGIAGILTLMGLLIASSTVTSVLNQVPFGSLFRLELRFILMFGGAVVVSLWLKNGYSATFIINLVVAACVLSVLTNVGYTILVRGRSLEAARFYIAPIAATVLFGLAVYPALKGNTIYFACSAIALASIYVAATRTYALGVAIIVITLIILSVRHHARLTLAKLITISLLAVATILVISFGGDDIWSQRFNYRYGIVDPTWQTRLAEYTSQWRLLTQNEWTLLFGKGLGSYYPWDLSTMRELFELGIANRSRQYGGSEFGHSFWIYSLYSQGLAFGWILPLIMCITLLTSLANAWGKSYDPEARRIGLQTALAMAGIFVATFFSHQFGDRLYCVVFGVTVVLVFWVRNRRLGEAPRHFGRLYGTKSAGLPLASGSFQNRRMPSWER